MSIIRYKRLASTNDKARILAEQGAREWTTVVAEVQTRGRGRSGKKWQSRKGGLWFSVILYPKIQPGKIGILQFLTSNAVTKTVREKTVLRVETKWPNDVVFGPDKIAGILIESKSKGNDVLFAIVGIGLNVNQSLSALPTGATSLHEACHEKYNLEQLMNGIIENMKMDFAGLNSPDEILSRWWANCTHRSKMVSIETADGTTKAISMGVEADGSLLVERNGRRERIIEGTLRILDKQRRARPLSSPRIAG